MWHTNRWDQRKTQVNNTTQKWQGGIAFMTISLYSNVNDDITAWRHMTTDGASITSTALHTAGLMRREHVGALMWSLESYIEQQKQHINTGVHLLLVERQNTDTEKASGALRLFSQGEIRARRLDEGDVFWRHLLPEVWRSREQSTRPYVWQAGVHTGNPASGE